MSGPGQRLRRRRPVKAHRARQVADRWHLWDNLCQVNTLVAAHHTFLIEPHVAPAATTVGGADCSGEPAGVAGVDQLRTPGPSAPDGGSWRSTPCTCRTYTADDHLQARLGRQNRAAPPAYRRCRQLVAGGVRTSKLDPFKPYLHQRLTARVRNATALHAEIVAQGYTGSYPVLERYLQRWRRIDAATVAQVRRPGQNHLIRPVTDQTRVG